MFMIVGWERHVKDILRHKSTIHKVKTFDKLNYIKNNYSSKDTMQRVKKASHRYLQHTFLIKAFLKKIYKEYLPINGRELGNRENSIETWARGLDEYFVEKDKNMADKHIKRCLISFIIKEVQIKPSCDTTTHLSERLK